MGLQALALAVLLLAMLLYYLLGSGGAAGMDNTEDVYGDADDLEDLEDLAVEDLDGDFEEPDLQEDL